ncbi:transcriptional regulator, LysR family [Paraburkholderia fungorum]|uniref:Transcriptional regulator, LysR family n=1 Tax=Paraburkholderia fungorum TaxID=134537 RepID=A0A1H1JLS8_9BURK|nr:LysR family transcriptional regulator [Paraburkholderia fungorum]SDR50387.1 transcriptional regulator, LysR family [Paraburkholderia fungorum]
MITFSRFTNYFSAIVEHGSIRKAAEALHVSASAIDRQVLQAEKEIGAPLFERVPGGLRLTAAGEVFVNLVRGWQRDYRRALTQIDELQGLKRGHIEVAIIDALTEGFVAEVIAKLAVDHPGLTVGVQVLDNDEVARKIVAGDVDFGLLLASESTKDLQIRASANAPLGVAFQPGHSLRDNADVRVSHTLDHKPILPAPPLVISERVTSLFDRHDVDAQRFMACNNTQMMRSLVRQGVGVAVLCWLDVAVDVAAGQMEFRPLKDTHLKPLQLHLCVAARRQLSHGAREVIRYFETGMAGIGLT